MVNWNTSRFWTPQPSLTQTLGLHKVWKPSPQYFREWPPDTFSGSETDPVILNDNTLNCLMYVKEVQGGFRFKPIVENPTYWAKRGYGPSISRRSAPWIYWYPKESDNNYCSWMFFRQVAWPSGLRRWFKAPVSSEAWVRIPPLPRFFFSLIPCCIYTHSHGVFTPQQDDKTNVEPMHCYNAFYTRFVGPGVKGFMGMHRFNICLVVFVWCENTITPWQIPDFYPCFPHSLLLA